MFKNRGQVFKVQDRILTPNGVGGHTETFSDSFTIDGFLDLLSGTDYRGNVVNNAFIKDSTHVLLSDMDIRLHEGLRIVQASSGQTYQIVFVDDPVGLRRHLELYVKNEV